MSHNGRGSVTNNGKSDHATIAKGFQGLATRISIWVGSKWAFSSALFLVAVWIVTGPYFHYSNTWQLVINTATTIVTFLIVFLIQNTQNRDARAIHLKLDEIIRSIQLAHNEMIDIEKLSDEELAALTEKFERIRAKAEVRKQHRVNLGKHKTG